MRRLLFAALLVSAAIPALAATPAPSPTPSTKAEVPPPPTISDDNTGPEPEVRIIQKGKEKIEEYRMNGHLYMVKVTPAVGPAYYLIDEEGNGQLKQVNPNRRIVTPQWVLKRF